MRVERRVLGCLEDDVSNAVVAAALQATIVAAMKGVVAHFVERRVARWRAAVSWLHEGDAEAVRHRHSKRPRVNVEVERRRWKRIKPVPGVGESEREKTSAIAGGRGGEELRALVGVNFVGEGVLRAVGRKESE